MIIAIAAFQHEWNVKRQRLGQRVRAGSYPETVGGVGRVCRAGGTYTMQEAESLYGAERLERSDASAGHQQYQRQSNHNQHQQLAQPQPAIPAPAT